MIGLLRSENLKVFTTKVWWGMLIGLLGCVGLALLTNGGYAVSDLGGDDPEFNGAAHAANVYTSGQYFGIMFAAILGALLMTNEYRHQTLTGTFLATPNRVKVLGGKLIVILAWGVVYALFTTIINIPIGITILGSTSDNSTYLNDGGVIKAIGLNLLAFALWAAIGFGVGSMFRSQAGALITLLVMYFVSSRLLAILLGIVGAITDHPGLLDLYWYLPNGATDVMTSAGNQLSLIGDSDNEKPAWWVGTIFLLAYGGATATVGMLLTLKRDVG
jgi:ABC-2 type transport system permease protein